MVKHIVVGLVLGMLVIPFQHAQSSSLTTKTLRDLHDARWQVRRNAFEHLAAVSDAASNPRISGLLISLREKEDLAAEGPGPDLFEDDDYLAYDGELTQLVQTIAESNHDARAWRSLVYMRYNGDSEVGKWLGSHYAQTLPFLIQQLKSRLLVRRATSVYVVALCLTNMPASAAEYKWLKRRIRYIAAYDEAPADQYAIQGLALLKDPSDISLLLNLAKRANVPETRQIALQAVRGIQKSP